MPKDFHTISMAGSIYDWPDVDKRARQLGFKQRSVYVQHLVEKDLNPKKIDKIIKLIAFLLILVVMLEVLAFIVR